MAFANIMVHMDTSRRSRLRLFLAVKLAQEYQASLTGLLTVCAPHQAWMYQVTDSERHLEAHRQHVEGGCQVMHVSSGHRGSADAGGVARSRRLSWEPSSAGRG